MIIFFFFVEFFLVLQRIIFYGYRWPVLTQSIWPTPICLPDLVAKIAVIVLGGISRRWKYMCSECAKWIRNSDCEVSFCGSSRIRETQTHRCHWGAREGGYQYQLWTGKYAFCELRIVSPRYYCSFIWNFSCIFFFSAVKIKDNYWRSSVKNGEICFAMFTSWDPVNSELNHYGVVENR